MSNSHHADEQRYFLVQIEDGRKVRVAEYAVLGFQRGDPESPESWRPCPREQWCLGDVCKVALVVEGRIDGGLFADDTCLVRVGSVSGIILEIEI